jgi:hypothetical protein
MPTTMQNPTAITSATAGIRPTCQRSSSETSGDNRNVRRIASAMGIRMACSHDSNHKAGPKLARAIK